MTTNAAQRICNNLVKGADEGDINVEVECGGRPRRIWLTNVMHVPEAKGKILSFKSPSTNRLRESHLADHVRTQETTRLMLRPCLGGNLWSQDESLTSAEKHHVCSQERWSAADYTPGTGDWTFVRHHAKETSQFQELSRAWKSRTLTLPA